MDRYAMLKQRSAKCCCRYCGKPLEVRMVIYNKYGGAGAEIFCDNCMKSSAQRRKFITQLRILLTQWILTIFLNWRTMIQPISSMWQRFAICLVGVARIGAF